MFGRIVRFNYITISLYHYITILLYHYISIQLYNYISIQLYKLIVQQSHKYQMLIIYFLLTFQIFSQNYCSYCLPENLTNQNGYLNCSLCSNEAVLISTIVLIQTWYNFTLGICQPCPQNCNTCFQTQIDRYMSGPYVIGCRTCKPKFTLNQRRVTQCLPCPADCQSCITGGVNGIQCTVCEVGYQVSRTQTYSFYHSVCQQIANYSFSNQSQAKQTKIQESQSCNDKNKIQVICLSIQGSLATVIATVLIIMYLRKNKQKVYRRDESVAAEGAMEASDVI